MHEPPPCCTHVVEQFFDVATEQVVAQCCDRCRLHVVAAPDGEHESVTFEAVGRVGTEHDVGGRIVGTSSIELDSHGRQRALHVAVFGITILKQYRGDGIGKQFMETMIEHSKTYLDNIKLIKLSAFADNKTALGLYEKFGFYQVGRVPNAYLRKGEYTDEVTMVKEL